MAWISPEYISVRLTHKSARMNGCRVAQSSCSFWFRSERVCHSRLSLLKTPRCADSFHCFQYVDFALIYSPNGTWKETNYKSCFHIVEEEMPGNHERAGFSDGTQLLAVYAINKLTRMEYGEDMNELKSANIFGEWSVSYRCHMSWFLTCGIWSRSWTQSGCSEVEG